MLPAIRADFPGVLTEIQPVAFRRKAEPRWHRPKTLKSMRPGSVGPRSSLENHRGSAPSADRSKTTPSMGSDDDLLVSTAGLGPMVPFGKKQT